MKLVEDKDVFLSKEHDKRKYKRKLNISEELAQGEKGDMLRGTNLLFQDGRWKKRA